MSAAERKYPLQATLEPSANDLPMGVWIEKEASGLAIRVEPSDSPPEPPPNGPPITATVEKDDQGLTIKVEPTTATPEPRRNTGARAATETTTAYRNHHRPRKDGGAGADEDLHVEEISLQDVDPELALHLALNEQKYAVIGLIIGALTVAVGAVLVFMHSAGSFDLQIHSGGTEIQLKTVVVGVVIAACGGLIIWLTRPKIKIKGAKIDAKKAIRG